MPQTSLSLMLVAALALGAYIEDVSAAEDRKSTTVACKAVNKVAKVGTFEGTVVSVTIIEKEPECRFSINGAEVGSPPTSAVINGINSIIRGDAGNEVSNDRFDQIGFALLAASPDTTVQSDLTQLLRNERRTLIDCLRRDSAQAFPSLSPGNNRSVLCGRLDGGLRTPEVTVKAGGGSAISLGLLEPVLVIGAARGGQTHYLLIPIARAASRFELRLFR